jgi:hypothetical protein
VSYVTRGQVVQFTSSLSVFGDSVHFIVTAADDPDNPSIGESASDAWSQINSRAIATQGSDFGPVHYSEHGADMFGFSDARVQKLMARLPQQQQIDYFD